MVSRSFAHPLVTLRSIIKTVARGHATLVWIAWASMIAGCGSLPDTQFLTRQYTTEAARFQNAWGPLPAKSSAALMAELKRKAGDLDILERQAALEQALV